MRLGNAALILCTLAVACKGRETTPRTMQYFKDNAPERAAAIEMCTKSERKTVSDEECGSAMRAQRQINIDHDAGTGKS